MSCLSTKVQKILDAKNDTPMGQLTRLDELRVIDFVRNDTGCLTAKYRVGVPHLNTWYEESQTKPTLRGARTTASRNILIKVAQCMCVRISPSHPSADTRTGLRASPPLSPSHTRRPSPLSRRQLAQKKEDRTHYSALEKIYNEYDGASSQQSLLLSIDMEQFDQDQSINLEFGFTTLPVRSLFDISATRVYHLINRDRLNKHNTRVPDHRFSFDVRSCASSVLAEEVMGHTLTQLIEAECESYNTVYLIGHSIEATDLKWAARLGVRLPPKCVLICDIAKVFRLHADPDLFNIRSMEHITKALGLACPFMHNAGNDSFYNIKAFQTLAIGHAYSWPQGFFQG